MAPLVQLELTKMQKLLESKKKKKKNEKENEKQNGK